MRKVPKAPDGLSNDERFDRRWVVDQSSGCHLWQGSVTKYGHGLFNEKQPDGRYKTVIAHRYAYQRRYGNVPQGKIVCHCCNIHGCVNDEHLYAGTDATNCDDARRAGRHISVRPELQQGEANGRAKLSAEQVAAIRRAYRPGNQLTLARHYGVNRTTIGRIVRMEGWKNVG